MNGLVKTPADHEETTVRLKLGRAATPPAGSDTAALAAGFITVSILTLDANAAPAEGRRLDASILKLPPR